MRVAAFETSTDIVSVALRAGGGETQVRSAASARERGRRLLPFLDELLGEAGWKVGDVELFAASVGPGSYTGVRVGLSLAKSLAYGAGRPLVGVNSLDVLAAELPPADATRPLVCTANAFRGELFAALLGPEEGGRRPRLGEDRCLTAAALLADVSPDFLALGDGAEAAAEAFAAAGVELREGVRPGAGTLARLAAEAVLGDVATNPLEVVPLHLRSLDREFRKLT